MSYGLTTEGSGTYSHLGPLPLRMSWRVICPLHACHSHGVRTSPVGSRMQQTTNKCTAYSSFPDSEPGNKNNTTQWHDTGNISNKSRVRTEVDATCKKMLDPIAGSPATRKPWIERIVLSTTVAELYFS